MASDNNQEIDHKTSQETRKTSLLLKTDIGSRKKEQPNLSDIQWKLRSINRTPKVNPTRLSLRILVHHWNQKLIPLPRRQREDIQNNPKKLALPPITNRGLNTSIGPRSFAPKG